MPVACCDVNVWGWGGLSEFFMNGLTWTLTDLHGLFVCFIDELGLVSFL
ncbi:MAG: hypothetical protein KJ592_04670 [Nanoarchaeota archaeon]|nr:hypothetical protein [Nanoarchaeota archaeon]